LAFTLVGCGAAARPVPRAAARVVASAPDVRAVERPAATIPVAETRMTAAGELSPGVLPPCGPAQEAAARACDAQLDCVLRALRTRCVPSSMAQWDLVLDAYGPAPSSAPRTPLVRCSGIDGRQNDLRRHRSAFEYRGTGFFATILPDGSVRFAQREPCGLGLGETDMGPCERSADPGTVPFADPHAIETACFMEQTRELRLRLDAAP